MMKEIKQYTISFEELKSTLLLVVNKKIPIKDIHGDRKRQPIVHVPKDQLISMLSLKSFVKSKAPN
jgi:hypothetical protein